ncbi:MAG: ester cyclase [Bryobacteraceae bacterium]
MRHTILIAIAAAATAFASPVEDANKALMRRFYEEVWFKGNLAVADEVFAPAYKAHDPRSERGAVDEKAEAQKQIAGYWRDMADIGGKVEFQVAEGDLVTTHWVWRVRLHSGWRRMLAGVDAFELPVVQTVRISGGKVVEIWSLRDDLGMQEHLGALRMYWVEGFIIGLLAFAVAARIWRRPRPTYNEDRSEPA